MNKYKITYEVKDNKNRNAYMFDETFGSVENQFNQVMIGVKKIIKIERI